MLEIYSAYLYWSMASYFDSHNLTGLANWMKVQAREELFHAQKFYDYINERGSRVIMQEVHLTINLRINSVVFILKRYYCNQIRSDWINSVSINRFDFCNIFWLFAVLNG